MFDESQVDSLEAYKPQLPIGLLVERLNRVYHANEARGYDRMHPEISAALPQIWRNMLCCLPSRRTWRILDFGCGTGFEANQAIVFLGQSIEVMCCYDLSPEMLARCRSRTGRFDNVTFTTELADIVRYAPFDLLLTNSLLHHLPNIESTLNDLLSYLTEDAYWIAGHEPSMRFYDNFKCCALLHEYLQQRRWAKFAEPGAYIRRLKRMVGIEPDPLKATAMAAFKQGWFEKMPSEIVISRLVDFHVAHSPEEAKQGRGFDYERLQRLWENNWSLEWVKTYSFLGPMKEVDAPIRWQHKAGELATEFPSDGANFSCVWRRRRFSTESR